MTLISDEDMQKRLAQTKEYCTVILKAGPDRHIPGVGKIIREHARRNFVLREEGVLSIVCPVADGSEVRGIGIFNAGLMRLKRLWMMTRAYGKGFLSMRSTRAGVFPGLSVEVIFFRWLKKYGLSRNPKTVFLTLFGATACYASDPAAVAPLER